MRKELLIVLCLFTGYTLCYAKKPEVPSNIRVRAERKMQEIDQIVGLHPGQQNKMLDLCDSYCWSIDSATYILTEPALIVEKKAEAKKNFFLGLLQILSPNQMDKYLETSATPSVKEKTEELFEKNPDLDAQKTYNKIFNYFMKERVIQMRYKYEPELKTEKLSELRQKEPAILRILQKNNPGDLKIAEIDSIVTLTSQQKVQLVPIMDVHIQYLDSAKLASNDPAKSRTYKNTAHKYLFTELMKILDESQLYIYLKPQAEPAVEEKSQLKLSYLKNTGEYSSANLTSMYEEIYQHLMIEKITSIRYKYEPQKCKTELSRLKTQAPNSLRKANALEKLASKGKTYTNGYQW